MARAAPVAATKILCLLVVAQIAPTVIPTKAMAQVIPKEMTPSRARNPHSLAPAVAAGKQPSGKWRPPMIPENATPIEFLR